MSSRRWVHLTAFGADDVPEVKSRFQSDSTSGSGPRSTCPESAVVEPAAPEPAAPELAAPELAAPELAASRASSKSSTDETGGSSESAYRVETRSPPGRSSDSTIGDMRSRCLGSVMSSCTSV